MRERLRISPFLSEKGTITMSENENNKARAAEMPENPGAEKEDNQESAIDILKSRLEEIKEKSREAQEAIREGKGRLKLETPIKVGDTEIEELVYDFTDLTGLEYTSAMDGDANAREIFKITYRQGLSLFATAAAKHTERVDSRDIIERIGMTDAVEGVQLATLFFSASTRAGRLRISKK